MTSLEAQLSDFAATEIHCRDLYVYLLSPSNVSDALISSHSRSTSKIGNSAERNKTPTLSDNTERPPRNPLSPNCLSHKNSSSLGKQITSFGAGMIIVVAKC